MRVADRRVIVCVAVGRVNYLVDVSVGIVNVLVEVTVAMRIQGEGPYLRPRNWNHLEWNTWIVTLELDTPYSVAIPYNLGL